MPHGISPCASLPRAKRAPPVCYVELLPLPASCPIVRGCAGALLLFPGPGRRAAACAAAGNCVQSTHPTLSVRIANPTRVVAAFSRSHPRRQASLRTAITKLVPDSLSQSQWKYSLGYNALVPPERKHANQAAKLMLPAFNQKYMLSFSRFLTVTCETPLHAVEKPTVRIKLTRKRTVENPTRQNKRCFSAVARTRQTMCTRPMFG